MNASEIEIINKTPTDYIKVVLAIILLLGGFAFYYMAAGSQETWLRGLVLGIALIAGIAIFLTSSTGASLIVFFRAAYTELLRVVWPSQKETGQMTLIVFGFVVIMSIFLWVIDKAIEYTLFDVLLGWSK